MADRDVKWGLVSTIKAEPQDILAFAAWHLEAGAHRLFLYLDAPCPAAQPFLKAHPKIRVVECGERYWLQRRKQVPEKHQERQTLNATRAYRRQARDVDWLAHIDVDEFLWSERPIAEQLAELPAGVHCARVRPIEALAGDPAAFKAAIPPGPDRSRIAGRLYPRFGSFLKAGMLSHTQGKLFLRTGLEDVQFRIHNVFCKGEENPGQAELAGVDLCHLHASSWEDWLAQYRYRLAKGSYRADLSPARPREAGGVTLHELLSAVEAENGLAGLRAFFGEVCGSPELRARLEAEGLLRLRPLPLEQLRRKHFPGFG
ncbi:glycosyltransferase family 2 protein [Roseobacteraceae bacterium NS-SX3]